MTATSKPIIITPEQIIGAAQKIVNATDDAWEFTEVQALAAVENYLRCMVSDILADADWHARKDNFQFVDAAKYTTSFVEEANELIMPPAPEWAR